MSRPEARVTTVTPRLIAAVRSRTTRPGLPAAIRAGLDKVWPQIIDRRGLNVVVYHPSEPHGLGKEFEIETGVEVAAGFQPAAPVYLTETPAGRVVTAAHLGPYDKMAAAYDAIHEYVRTNRLELAGPSWEVYGHHSDDPAKLRTDVFFPIRESPPPRASR
jgi:effector-binding domain-containing protein